MKALIVDDSPSNLKLLRAILESENYQVIEAADGLQALAVLDKENVDAVISDILMPRMDGYRLCYEVRKNEKLQELPFIFYTATYTSASDEKLCYDLGADKYLQKPASTETVLTAIKEASHSPRRNTPEREEPLSDSDVMKEYSERLVSKLETKNLELEQTKENLEQAKLELMGRTKDLECARVELEKINRELDDRVRQRTKELEASNMELEAFSYSVSHDLRAPLRHIGAYAEMILRNGGSQMNPASLWHTKLIVEAVQKMGGIIDALLELTRVTHSEIHRVPIDLSALAREVFAEVQHAEPHRVVSFDVAAGLVASGDQRLLRVVLINLLGNAFKFTSKKDGAQIQFTKTSTKIGPAFMVRDNGAGFDMAYADKLFGAFQRLHNQNEFKGTGIGLATVQRIIHRHNGKTWAESAPGKGATFFFTVGGASPKKHEQPNNPQKGAA